MISADRIASLVNCPVLSCRPLHGGDISSVVQAKLADGRSIVAKHGPHVQTEACMLQAMAASTAPAPRVIAVDGDLLAMDFLDADGPIGWSDLAAALHLLHGARGESYGWAQDYAFGTVPIANASCEDWPRFWADNRLLCHVPHLPSDIARRIEALAERLDDILPERPLPSLLHGDLWGGNILSRGGRIAALLDPACYYGHREVDVAMLTLFDHPPASFFSALDLEAGWRDRLPAYRLWPLLVHLRLFGSSYRGAVEGALGELGV